MLSLTAPNPIFISGHDHHRHHNRHKSLLSSIFISTVPSLFNFPSSTTTPRKPSLSKPISAANQPSPPQIGIIPATPSRNPQPQNLYQPFRPPPSPVPSQYRNLDTAGRIEILSNRLGLWFEYAPLISALYREGFTPSTIEELTGISGVEQNRLIVAAQVRESFAQSSQLEPEILSDFDQGGAELLYEIRLLSASQRAAAAKYLVLNRWDGNGARDVARAIKDFPRRKKDVGWNYFDYNLTGDCVSFMYFRQSMEHPNPSDKRTTALQKALEVVESDRGRKRVLEELEGKRGGSEGMEGEMDVPVTVPVVRLKMGEVAEATSVMVLPVCMEEDKEAGLLSAPFKCDSEGEFGVVVSDKGWDRWVVLPGWEPVAALGKGGVVVSFASAEVLPWKVNMSYKEEAILVVADRARKEVTMDDGFYLVMRNRDDGVGDGLKVERGSTLKGTGVYESLGTVVLVVRPPRDDMDDQLSDEDWD